jgi:ubiquinone/menaquinone biosynthesis C-methylase UbiE
MKPSVYLRMWKSSLPLRIWLAAHFRGSIPRLYSVLDADAEVPGQTAAYRLAANHYLRTGDSVLDVGFGLGYGLKIMSEKANRLSGIDIDRKAIAKMRRSSISPKIKTLDHYDGYSIPFSEDSFDLVTCIDVLEHVPDYMRLIRSMCKVSRRHVVISTPNRRPEYMNRDGSPKNPWHIREWSFEEFDQILKELGERYEWNFLNGPWDGPFTVSQSIKDTTLALTPVIIIGDG